MTISVQKQPQCLGELEVEIPAETVEAKRNDIVGQFLKEASIPGFRKGKVPRKMLEKRFAKQISEELDSTLMRDAFQSALKENEDLKIVDVSWPESLESKEDGSSLFKAEFIYAPDFSLPEYKGLTVEYPKAEVTDEVVEQQLHNMRERFASYEEITDRAAEEDDILTISFTATCEGKPISEVAEGPVPQLESAEEINLPVNEDAFLPGFTTQLVGMKPEETREVTVPLQEDFMVETLQGKDLDISVTLTKIHIQKLPDDELILSMMMPGGSMEELTEAVREQLENQLKTEIKEMQNNRLLGQICDAVELELPEKFLQQRTQQNAYQMVSDAMSKGVTQEQIESERDEITDHAGRNAALDLKSEFVISEIADKEEITVDDKEMLALLTQMAQQENEPVQKFIKRLNRENRLEDIRARQRMSKTIEFLAEKTTFVEVEPETE